MKKILILLCIIILGLPTLADDSGFGDIGDTMNYSGTFDNAFLGQEKVTDDAFQKALEEKKSQDKKHKKKKKFKGSEINQENTGIHLEETAEKNIILTVPLELINGDGTTIPAGHYKIVGEIVDSNPILNFYQSSSLIAKVPAIETKHDFDENEINFVKLLPYNEKRVQIIFGSIDFNAYTFLNIRH